MSSMACWALTEVLGCRTFDAFVVLAAFDLAGTYTTPSVFTRYWQYSSLCWCTFEEARMTCSVLFQIAWTFRKDVRDLDGIIYFVSCIEQWASLAGESEFSHIWRGECISVHYLPGRYILIEVWIRVGDRLHTSKTCFRASYRALLSTSIFCQAVLKWAWHPLST